MIQARVGRKLLTVYAGPAAGRSSRRRNIDVRRRGLPSLSVAASVIICLPGEGHQRLAPDAQVTIAVSATQRGPFQRAVLQVIGVALQPK